MRIKLTVDYFKKSGKWYSSYSTYEEIEFFDKDLIMNLIPNEFKNNYVFKAETTNEQEYQFMSYLITI